MALRGPQLAVIIPARDEAAAVPLLLADLAQGQHLIAELLVVDGGSTDGTPARARLAGAQVLHCAPGRGGQLLAGIAATTAPMLWLLHGDVRLPPHWPRRLEAQLAMQSQAAARPMAWFGELKVPLAPPQYRLMEALVALRSRVLQRPYGDQGLLISREAYRQAGGLRPLALMEDLDFAERFSRCGRFAPLGLTLLVSPRRWRRHGLLGTSWRNARLRRAWRQGVCDVALSDRYRS
ncbi:MAG: TIGR04283 family arsenosugar biosynthesis glycosyltransferase [Prochlorococcaceae cyanobacterium]